MTHSLFWRWMLGLDAIPAGATGIELTWQHPLAGWAWVLCAVGASVFAWWSYTRLVGPKGTRISLGLVRTMLSLLLITLAAGPLLRLPIIESEPDWLVVLLDRSRSMSIADTRDGSGEYVDRDTALHKVIADPIWGAIDVEKEILWLGFDTSARDIDQSAFGPPDGWSTDLSVPIETALRRLAGRPASAIVVVSDGRTVRPIDREVMRAAHARAIPVFAIPLGSATALTDMSVAQVDAPERAFVRDHVPVVVRLESSGGRPHTPITVELRDTETGQIIDTVTLSPEEFAATNGEAVMTGAQGDDGTARWSVRVVGEGDDLVKGNNERNLEIEFIDRPLRVLYIEGYPRWEYRYLKNLLVREQSLESSVMLLSADRDFAQEGNAPLERLPQSAEEFRNYDLFILGDVPAGSLSQTQIANLVAAVGERGAGLLWIAGERSTPGSWRGTELEDLLPIRGVPERFDERVIVEPMPGAARSGVLQLGESARDRWPSALSERGSRAALEWCQRIERDTLKPTAEVLASARTLSSADAFPLIITMRYGAGVVLYVGTDETWRWRHGIGETFHERFWIQFIRYLARGTVQRDDQPFHLTVEPRHPEVGVPALIRVDVQEAKAGDVAGDGPLEATSVVIDSSVGHVSQSTQLVRDGSQWVGSWTPQEAGTWRVHVDSPRTGPLEHVIEVVRNDAELLRGETDHAQLADIAQRTGGAVVAPPELSRLKELLPRRALNKEQSIIDPLWSSPGALILVLTLLLVEWIGRRGLRLA